MHVFQVECKRQSSFIRKILAKLVDAKWVEVIEGKSGGYTLRSAPDC
ncbi:Rrf2 family transcriptional regulator [Chengkuizengella sediminis]|nr:Rrf2 family transcriptional regulator [Chengkuizengella sediminis]